MTEQIDLADRIVELVREAVPGVTVFDGDVPPADAARPDRYVVLWVPAGVREGRSVGPTHDRTRFHFRVTCAAYGDTIAEREHLAWQARWMASRIRDHLTRNRLTVGGTLIRHDDSQPPTRDEAVVARTALFATDGYTARA